MPIIKKLSREVYFVDNTETINMTDEQIILKDMKSVQMGQNSWDWQADYRFAKAINADDSIIKLFRALLKSSAPFALQIAIHKKFMTKIKNRRLKALRNLAKQGIVETFWIGTGYGGYSEFGVRRIKTWRLINRQRKHSDI